jgi:hypothetical protein
MGDKDLLQLFSESEDRFVEIVRVDSLQIPLSVKLYLSNRIRNAMVGIDRPTAERVVEALKIVGM